jgi:tRNA A37 methylthiotransferase MiaB
MQSAFFGYSDEDKTEALTPANKVDQDLINQRVKHLSTLVDEAPHAARGRTNWRKSTRADSGF